ncbi:hypothetical protein LJ737_19535 [Hymenobacter sp. 15J16-1T3B]|uniref:hypothetical protein n=1 Tax=Hymenobacter sp. 15J16-1T3B TaxID=2886941 RepID=UPI001D0F5441|nr:hypothetical protein [Hymenobacter sp. 15J16-1T3B]MCC3159443.1 hypothetical protein [Hymenobacter sp. 15J16-1T3B]
MVFRKRLGQLLAFFALTSCGPGQPSGEAPVEEAPAPPAVAANPAQQRQRTETVRRFLRWYQQAQPRLDQLLTATVRKAGQGDTAHYQVDAARATAYLQYLRQAGWFSPEFIDDQRQQFGRRDADFRRTRQAYGPPVGFEYGWILYTPRPAVVVATALQRGRIDIVPGAGPQWQARVKLPGTGSLILELTDAGDSTKINTIYPSGIEQDLGQ